MTTINLYFDFKFTSLSPDAQPISLGIVSDICYKREYYDLSYFSKERQKYLSNYFTPELIRLVRVAGFVGFFEMDIPNEFRKHYGDARISCFTAPIEESIEPKSFYAEFTDFDISRCDDWVKENVADKLIYNHLDVGYNDPKIEFENNVSIKRDTSWIKKMLKVWLKQFSGYNIQFVCDCGTFDWYWMLQLLAEWKEEENKEADCSLCGHKSEYYHIFRYKFGLPRLPTNISPVPQDLNDLIAQKKGISINEAFCYNREVLAYGKHWKEDNKSDKHNALWDAKVIKEIYNKLS